MYFLEPSSEDSKNLRQGDILINVPFFGAIDMAKGMITFEQGIDPRRRGYQISTYESVPCLVVSACCEMSRSNAGKSNTVIVAPWKSLKSGGKPEVMEALRNPNLSIINELTNFRYIWCANMPDVAIAEGLFDLSAVFSISKGSQDYLLTLRVKSASLEYRTYIQQKTAVFFTRME